MEVSDPIDELRGICPGAQLHTDGGLRLVHLPNLPMTVCGTHHAVDALLCLDAHSGYPTRLFIARPFPEKSGNWTTHVVMGRQWHALSWGNVMNSLRPTQILAEHLRALR